MNMGGDELRKIHQIWRIIRALPEQQNQAGQGLCTELLMRYNVSEMQISQVSGQTT